MSLNDLMRHRADFVNENWLIYTAADKVLVDDVVRFENLEVDLARISTRIGLDHNLYNDMKGIKAKAGFRPEKQVGEDSISAEDAGLIRALCRKEVETFQYAWPASMDDGSRSTPLSEGVSP